MCGCVCVDTDPPQTPAVVDAVLRGPHCLAVLELHAGAVDPRVLSV